MTAAASLFLGILLMFAGLLVMSGAGKQKYSPYYKTAEIITITACLFGGLAVTFMGLTIAIYEAIK